MNFENSFTVAVPPEKVWEAMMDFERVAPCMPGAEVTERTGDDSYKVQVRVKVGPMSMTYRGQAEIAARDDETRRAAMRVQARETRGQGTANATVDIKLAAEDAGTRATMATELKLSGEATEEPRSSTESPMEPSPGALDAGQLARGVFANRMREPRALAAAGGLLALAGLAVGFKLGRRAGRRW
jgi:carbon monoxide dehydrogenase subunit G